MVDEANRQLWRERIEQWRTTGLTQKAFAREHGCNCWQMSYWNGQFKEQNKVDWVPVIVKGTAQKILSTGIALRSPSGWNLSLPSHCSAAWLGEILQGLR